MRQASTAASMRRRRGLARRAAALVLICALALSQLLGCIPAPAYAETGAQTFSWRQTGLMVKFTSGSGNTAYCADQPWSAPDGMTLTEWYYTGRADAGRLRCDPHSLAWLVSQGYPYTRTPGGRPCDDPQDVTAMAIWMLRGYVGQDGMSVDDIKFDLPSNTNHITTQDLHSAWQLSRDALGHAGETGTWDTLSKWWPSPRDGVQGMVECMPEPQTGSLRLTKSSANPQITEGNGCYSLEGAVYGIYADEKCTDKVAEMTTSADGSATADGLAVATYYVREITPPRGYALDRTVHELALSGGQTSDLKVQELPQNSTAAALVQKVDRATGTASPQGDATLAGAEFELAYYDGLYQSVEELPDAATRTWVLRTDGKGATSLALAAQDRDTYLVKGDAFYTDSKGAVTLPLGTLTIRESRAPEGYEMANGGARLFQITGSGTDEHVSSQVSATFEEEIVRGGLSVPKIDHELQDGVAQGDATLAGAVLSVTNASAAPVLVGGVKRAPGEEVMTITTNAEGHASTGPQELPYGTYVVTEKTAPRGYLRNESWTQTVEVRETGKVNVTAELPESVGRGGLSVPKIDHELQDGVAQGDATLAGAVLSVTNASAAPVLVGGSVIGCGEVALTIETNEGGVAATAADALPVGTYTVRETRAPQGYLVNDEWSFSFTIEQDGDWVEAPALPDPVERGGIAAQKVDGELRVSVAQGDARIAGAVISIVNSSEGPVVVEGRTVQSGEEALEIVTDESGVASAPAGALPYGTYTLSEKSAPEGYLLNEEWSATFSVREDGSITDLTDEPLPETPARGSGAVTKVDGELLDSVAQGDAALAGAEISIYNRSAAAIMVDGVYYQPGQCVARIVTDESGHASTTAGALPYGTYEMVETGASQGYLVNEGWSQTFQIREDGQVVTVENLTEPIIRGGVSVRKVDADWGVSSPQGDATLAGARIEVINRSQAGVMVEGTWYEKDEVVTTLVTDETGRATTTADLLPYGTYELREVAGPSGYHADDEWSRVVEIRENGQVVDLTSDKDVMRDPVMRGGISLQKVDRELEANGSQDPARPLGAATLEGASFEVTNRSAQPVVVAGTTYAAGDVVMTIVTDESGFATTGERALPYGTYEVTESAPPEGYLLNEDWSQTVEVREDGHMYELAQQEERPADQVRRGDLSLSKADEATQERLAGVPFKITSKTTGEWHLLVTDENGMADTSAPWSSHETNTNANDGALREDDTVDDTLLNATSGLWFSGRTDDSTAPDDGLGALPYDTYVLEELPCAANEGYALVSTDVIISRHAVTIDLGTFDDHHISLSTRLSFGSGASRSVPVAPEVRVEDEVSVSGNLSGHDYVLKGEIHAFGETGEDKGVVSTSERAWTPSGEDGSVKLEYVLDTTGLSGCRLVCFERLLDGEKVVASHDDPDDEDQTLYVPGIATTLLSDATSDHDAPSWADSKMTDTVHLTGLTVGESYVVSGELRLRSDDGGDEGPVTTEAGEPVMGQLSFQASARDMDVQLGFEVPTSRLAGRTVVAYETLSNDQGTLVSHGDISDEAQTVRLPLVQTEALNAATGDHQSPQEDGQALVDTVSLSNLVVGREYVLRGSVHLKEVGDDGTERDGGVLTLEDGTEVRAESTFVAEAEDMTVELQFPYDASVLGERDVVAYEELYRDNVLLARHTEIEDEGQTLHVPELATTATVGETGEHTLPAAEGQVVVDRVRLTNLIEGKEYEVSGTLNLKDGTGGTTLESAGGPIAATTSFVAEGESAEVELNYPLDATGLEGEDLVVFERLSSEGVTLAVHADEYDAEQTVHVPEAEEPPEEPTEAEPPEEPTKPESPEEPTKPEPPEEPGQVEPPEEPIKAEPPAETPVTPAERESVPQTGEAPQPIALLAGTGAAIAGIAAVLAARRREA